MVFELETAAVSVAYEATFLFNWRWFVWWGKEKKEKGKGKREEMLVALLLLVSALVEYD